MNVNSPLILNQDRHWSRHAAGYDDVFLDPFAPGVENPLWDILERDPGTRAEDGGRPGLRYRPPAAAPAGTIRPGVRAGLRRGDARKGPRAARARPGRRRDFPPPRHARARRPGRPGRRGDRDQLPGHAGRPADRPDAPIDPDEPPPGGVFLGIVPSIDAIHYHTMLLFDQALDHGLDPKEAERFTAFHAEHRYYDFAFGRFRFQGLRQKFWQPFEVEHRLKKAGFRGIRLGKVLYPWDESLAGGAELGDNPPSWDWFFEARL